MPCLPNTVGAVLRFSGQLHVGAAGKYGNTGSIGGCGGEGRSHRRDDCMLTARDREPGVDRRHQAEASVRVPSPLAAGTASGPVGQVGPGLDGMGPSVCPAEWPCARIEWVVVRHCHAPSPARAACHTEREFAPIPCGGLACPLRPPIAVPQRAPGGLARAQCATKRVALGVVEGQAAQMFCASRPDNAPAIQPACGGAAVRAPPTSR